MNRADYRDDHRNGNNRRFIISNEVFGSVALERVVKVGSIIFCVVTLIVFIISLATLTSNVEVYDRISEVTHYPYAPYHSIDATYSSKYDRIVNYTTEYRTRTVPARESILIRQFYFASLIQWFISVYLVIACWKKYSVGILAWLLLIFFVFCNSVMMQFYILSQTLHVIIVILFIYNGFVMLFWFLVYSYYIQNFRLTVGNCEPDYALPATPPSRLANSCICILRNCTLKSLQKRSIIIVTFVMCALWVASIVFMFLSVKEQPLSVFGGTASYLSAIVNTFALIGILRKYSLFVKIWLYFIGAFVISLVISQILLLVMLNEHIYTIAAIMIPLNVFIVLTFYCWLTVYSFHVRTSLSSIEVHHEVRDVPSSEPPSCPQRNEIYYDDTYSTVAV